MSDFGAVGQTNPVGAGAEVPVGAIRRPSFVQRHWPFLLILLVAAVSRVILLAMSQTHVQRDEAVIGLMGKHILEGRESPFYFSGQHYNAIAAWEAYLGALVFRAAGVGVLPLKGCILALSLVWLGMLYWLADTLYGRRAALWAAVALVLCPTLLKWNFLVRGYSFYLLAIPTLVLLFRQIDVSVAARPGKLFVFGLACGVTAWGLELGLPLIAALWGLLWVRGKLVRGTLGAAVAGALAGYSPAILYNLTHALANWRTVFVDRAGFDGWLDLWRPSVMAAVLFEEMPKFFGPDTAIFYFPEKPLTGYVFYAIAVGAIVLAAWPFVKKPQAVWRGIRAAEPGGGIHPDLLVLVLLVAGAFTYLTTRMRIPSYLLGVSFFLSLLTGRLLERSFSSGRFRLAGVAVLLGALGFGVAAMVEVARNNEIDTFIATQKGFQATRVPGKDIEAVNGELRRLNASSVTTSFFWGPGFAFESGETVNWSDIEGLSRFRFAPGENEIFFVLETISPYCEGVLQSARDAGLGVVATVQGGFTVMAVQKPREEHPPN